MSVCTPSDAEDGALVASLVAMVNAAYLRGEGLEAAGGMWKGSEVTRTTDAEMRELLRQRKLIICRRECAAAAAGESAAPLAGSVLCDVEYDPAQRVAELGMLCVDAACLGQGVGRRLRRQLSLGWRLDRCC